MPAEAPSPADAAAGPRPRPNIFALNRAARIAARGLGADAGLVMLETPEPAVGGSHALDPGAMPGPGELARLASVLSGTPGVALGDAGEVPGLSGLALVSRPGGMRFVAGVPVVGADGAPVGATWVFGRDPRTVGRDELAAIISFLNDVAAEVAHKLTPDIAEQRAHRAEARLTEAVEALGDGFVYFDAEDRMVLCNQRYRELMSRVAHALRPGVRFEEILRAGLASGEFPDAPEDTDGWIARHLEAHRNPGAPVEQELPGGRWMRIEEKRTATGGCVGLRVDITALKKQQIALEAARAELARQNEELERKVEQRTSTIAAQAHALESALAEEREVTKAQRRFVAMISHEFRTPLAIIDASAGRIGRKARRNDAGWVDDYVQHIQGSVRRLVTLIESVLGAAKSDAGTMVLKPVEFDLAEVIGEICADQQRFTPDREIRIAADLPAPVTGDKGLVYQVLVNLVGNAVKYSPSGEAVEVAARMEEEDVVVDVTDRGVGIPEEELPKMFVRFFRASTSSGIAGTGLGLNLAREIARMHGGDITIASREGEGSTFTFRMRAAGPPEASGTPEQEADAA